MPYIERNGGYLDKGTGTPGMKPHLTVPDNGTVRYQEEAAPKEEKVIGAK